jgi:hypothetical protein
MESMTNANQGNPGFHGVLSPMLGRMMRWYRGSGVQLEIARGYRARAEPLVQNRSCPGSVRHAGLRACG